MSGVYQEERLFCAACNAVKTHHTEWSSEEPKTIIAQCEHHGQRAKSFVTPAEERYVGGMFYIFV